jgi:hypothetical protein
MALFMANCIVIVGQNGVGLIGQKKAQFELVL